MKKILSYMAAGLMLLATACSDDIFDRQLSEIPSDGQLEFRYSVPEMQGVQTRATDENTVHTLTLFVFDGSGKLQQVEPLDPTKQSCDVTIDGKIRADKNISFLMLANAPEAYNLEYFKGKINVSSKDDVKILTSALTKVTDGDTDYLVMSGSASLNDILSFSSVALYRSAAKVSVNMGKKDAEGNFVKDAEGMIVLDEALPFVTVGYANVGSLFSGADTKSSNLILGKTPSRVNIPSTVTATEPVFVHPTKNKGEDQGGVYVVVKADYSGATYYYRLDFETEDYMDLEPNHYYQFVIDEVKGKGYTTPAEAAENPTPKSGGALEWNIVDHSPRVYNIVTDGKNSLGVSHSVTHTGNVTGNNVATEYFYVRVSNKDGNYDDPDLKAAANGESGNIRSNKSWLTIGSITPEAETVDDITTPGRLYKVEAKFSRTSDVGSQTASITVNWRGLSRVIPVVWNREFNAEDVVAKAVLNVYENGTTERTDWKQEKYFEFLDKNVWGVEAEANNGDARDEGFHFPLMYGDKTETPWTYKYSITLKNPDGRAYQWKIMVSDDSDQVIRDNVKINGNSGTFEFTNEASADGPTFELSMTGGSNVYGVGSLMIEVAPSGTIEWKPMSIAIYHTGFFHKDNYDHAVEGSYDNSKPYTYYGVVTIDNNRWLDRNIGAHSAELYVEGANGEAQHGTVAGRGAYYYVAQQNGTGHDLYTGICPPGYQVPYITDWDALRKSSKFNTTNFGSYTTAYYTTDTKKSDGTNLNIYLSKSGYYDAGDKAGDATVGYYWSQTTATGFEKDERGRWMKSFVIFGEATQTSNARIDYDGDKSGFAMSLRCVSTHPEVKDTEQANMFVRGATHVFAYSINPAGERVPVTTWPGTPIANYNTANANYINYRYLGATKAEELYLIFNYKSENGQIRSISKDGNTAKITTDISPNDLVGWKAVGDVAPNNSGDANHKTAVNDKTTSYYWNLYHSVKKVEKVMLTSAAQPYVPVVTTYQIHGTVFGSDWDTPNAMKPLTRIENTNIWEGTFAVSGGQFVIQKLEDGEEEDAYRSRGGNSSIDLGAQTLCVISNSNEDGNFILPAGTYLFSFNSASRMLVVLDPNADPREIINATNPVASGYHRVFWDNSSKNWNPVKIYCWNGDNKPFGGWPGMEMSKVSTSSNYYYADVPVGCQFIILNGSNDSQKTADLSLKNNDNIEDNTYKN